MFEGIYKNVREHRWEGYIAAGRHTSVCACVGYSFDRLSPFFPFTSTSPLLYLLPIPEPAPNAVIRLQGIRGGGAGHALAAAAEADCAASEEEEDDGDKGHPECCGEGAVSARDEKGREEGSPAPVLVLAPIPRSFMALRTRTKRAMSMAKAMRERRAARKEKREARRVTVRCVLRERRRAMNITAVAVGGC